MGESRRLPDVRIRWEGWVLIAPVGRRLPGGPNDVRMFFVSGPVASPQLRELRVTLSS
jgi:hypothetical protein